MKTYKNPDEMRESKVESIFNGLCESRGAIVRKFTSPGRRGVNDRLVFWPDAITHLVELKKHGEEPTKLQAHEHKELRRLDHKVYSLAGLREVVEYFNSDDVLAISDRDAVSTVLICGDGTEISRC